MRTLNLNELEEVQGGMSNFFTGLCVGASISAMVLPNPVSIGVSVGCIVYGGGEALDWW